MKLHDRLQKSRAKTRPHFYHDMFTLVIPIVIQNLITSMVSMADVVMLGRVSQTALSASSLAGQVQFLLNLVYFGLASSLTILGSQYWGKGDRRTIAHIFGIGLIISLTFSILATVLAFTIPYKVISIWTNDTLLRQEGAKYLRYVALSYFFMGFSQPYLSIMKSCERVRLSTVISATALICNVILNAILIFGLFGLPAMGIVGAAVATAISRGIELLICLVDYLHQEIFPRSIREIFTLPKSLLKDFGRYCLPAFLNDTLWGLAFNMNSIIMGHLGSDIVAANALVVNVRDIVTTVGFAISAASSILLGKELGSNQIERAKNDARSILRLTIEIAVIQGLILLAITPAVPHFAKLSDTATHYLIVMLLMNTVYQVGILVNTLLIASYFRCGGDSRYGMILDISSMWGWAVPMGLLAAFVWKLPPLWVYVVMCTDEWVKMPFAIHHYRSGNWIRNLTRDFPEETT